MKKFIFAAFSLILALILAGCAFNPAPAQTPSGDGGGDGGGDEVCEHEYHWEHDDDSHWQVCDLCGDRTDSEPHAFVDYECVCGAVTDAPPSGEQDEKNYFFVGHFGSMNWQQVREPAYQLARLAALDENGFTVYVKEIELARGDAFKIVNDGATEDFWENQINYTHLRGGDAAEYFGASAHDNFVNQSGPDGKYRVTLHTDPTDMGASFALIDHVGDIGGGGGDEGGGDEGGGDQHVHSFAETWTNNAYAHWHESLCGHNVTDGYDLHSFNGNSCSVCGYVKTDAEEEEYEFGDSISRENTAFYKDYSEAEKELYYTLWQETTSITVKIDIDGHELAKINEAYMSGDTARQDTYRKCNLTVTVNGTDYTYEEVGVRMRGNTSRRDFCDENGNIYAYVHLRFSLTETFDGEEYEGNAWASELYHDWTNDAEGRKARKDRTFATMEKFYYKWNKCYDQTYIREVYANRMFQAYGILAPHITLAEIDLKQGGSMERLGVGGLYEIVDKQFIKRNFDKEHKGGDLYKCTYTGRGPADLVNATYGIQDDDPYCLKTNDDPTDADWSNHKYIKAFIDMLNNRQGNFTEAFEAMMSPDYFARFEACNYLAGNPDCIRNHYNNYYLYFTPQGKAYLIPYDYDRCFGVTMEWNPQTGMLYTDPFAESNTDDGYNHNPLYTRTILGANAPYRDLYAGKLAKILGEEWFTLEHFQTIYEAYRAVYSTRTAPSQTIARQVRSNVSTGRMTFSLDGTKDFGSTSANISIADYMRIKRETALAALL